LKPANDAARRKDTQIIHLQGYGGRPYHTANVGTDVFDTEVPQTQGAGSSARCTPVWRFRTEHVPLLIMQAQALEHLQGDDNDLEVCSQQPMAAMCD
jgi:hypothetical protein